MTAVHDELLPVTLGDCVFVCVCVCVRACVFVMVCIKMLIFVCFVRLYTIDLYNYGYLCIVCFSLSCKAL